eukprot:2728717-Karenia_brevis.AAC.1
MAQAFRGIASGAAAASASPDLLGPLFSPKNQLGDASAAIFYPVGNIVTIQGLVARPELNGTGATVCGPELNGTGR